MEKDKLKDIGIYLSLGAGICYVLGMLITNKFLGDYNLIDFNLLHPQSIGIGLAFTLILLIHFVLYTFGINYDKLISKPFVINLILTLPRYVFISTLIFYVFNSNTIDNSIYYTRIFGYKLDLNVLYATVLFIVPVLIISSRKVFFRHEHSKPEKVVYWIAIISVSISFFAFGTYLNHPKFIGILTFETFIFMFFHTYLKILELFTEEIQEKTSDEFVFTIKPVIKGKAFIKFIGIFFAIFALKALIEVYCIFIYPLIPVNYGGGQPKQISYKVNNKYATGTKIYESNNFVYLKINDTTIKKLKADEIDEIHFHYKKP